MRGTMMSFPLTLHAVLERAGTLFPNVEIVSRRSGGVLQRQTNRDFYRRARALGEGLQRAGMQPGDRVATLMWNHHAHLECYFGIPAAAGIIHTLNLRLHPTELAYIVNHAEDRFLIVDECLLPLFRQFESAVKLERVFVAESAGNDHGFDNYEELLCSATGAFEYPRVDGDTGASMCYTSGTTGKPKGVLYSHAALVLHSFAFALPDGYCLSNRDVLMSSAPMFHANSHGVPFAATMLGCKQVLPGPHPVSEDLLDLFHSEEVTFLTGVPTVWLGILDALEKYPGRWKLARGLRALCAGTAMPENLMRRAERQGIQLIHAWGMTETTPVATVCTMKRHLDSIPLEEKDAIRLKQGYPLPFVEVRAENEGGIVPWDGQTLGELQVRGPWVAASYYKMPEAQNRWTDDGWLRTGDIVSIDGEGYIKIADRGKDLIKSGGEWISSVDLEGALMAHPAVHEAAVVGVPHPKWDERPLAVIVLREGMQASPCELRDFLAASYSTWQLPDGFVFVDELPHTSTGKLLKSELRKRYCEWKWAQTTATPR